VGPRVEPLAAILDLDTDLMLDCVDGLSDVGRGSGGGNPVTRR
jgi:hypothetical protein